MSCFLSTAEESDMLDTREATLDQQILRLILSDIRSDLLSEDMQDKRIAIGDIDACSRGACFSPIHDHETDLITTFVRYLEDAAQYGSEEWSWVADHVGPEGPDYYDHDTIPAHIAEEITAAIKRVLTTAMLHLPHRGHA
jgi:hypothetical protein